MYFIQSFAKENTKEGRRLAMEYYRNRIISNIFEYSQTCMKQELGKENISNTGTPARENSVNFKYKLLKNTWVGVFYGSAEL